MRDTQLKAILVHPNPVEREALSVWFERQSPLAFLKKVKDISCIAQLAHPKEVDVLIIFDYGTLQLSAQINALRLANQTLKFLIFKTSQSVSEVQDIVCAGVHGYIDLSCEAVEWDLAMKAVMTGHIYYSQQVMLKLAGAYNQSREIPELRETGYTLSRRELEVLNLVAKELSTPQIASTLFISPKTVETHRRNLFRKLGVKNAVGLAKAALRMGIS